MIYEELNSVIRSLIMIKLSTFYVLEMRLYPDKGGGRIYVYIHVHNILVVMSQYNKRG